MTAEQRDRLRATIPQLVITPSAGTSGAYDITPGSVVGAVHFDDLKVQIRPKVPIDRLLFLMSYAVDPRSWRQTPFDFYERDSLVEAVIPGFVFQVRRALRRGVLQGYQQREEALAGVKGRIRFDAQLRDRFGIMPPVEVTFDDFTVDILANQLLKTAAVRLLKLNLREREHRNELRHLLRGLAGVSVLEVDPRNVPKVFYSRLNDHYRPAVELARLILRSTSFELGHGTTAGQSFLLDMNALFEDFVVVALQEALGVSTGEFPQGARGRQLFLDSDRTVRLYPDLSWWADGEPVFVGDVKYKKLNVDEYKNADLYQLLAYTISMGLDDGVLIYASGEEERRNVHVQMAGKRLWVVTLDICGSPVEILDEVTQMAELIRELRAGARQSFASGASRGSAWATT